MEAALEGLFSTACYIVDFICLERHWVIEGDGAQHGDQVTYDRQRDQWLAAQGLTVLRFRNHDVLNRTEAVLEQIRLIVEAPSPPALSHEWERGVLPTRNLS